MTEPKRMKSNEVRVDWAEVLQHVRQGGTVVVEHYTKPIADITPHKETSMDITDVTADIPVDSSRATAAIAWRAVAINHGFGVEIVGKDNDENPLVERDGGDLYVLLQGDNGVVHAESYEPPTYTAAIALVDSVVAGDFCDVSVAENVIVGYREDEDGNEIPEYAMGTNVVLDPVETTVRTDEIDPWSRLEDEAVEILDKNGWRVVGDWEQADTAAYARVERA